jgi:hypothetical protein
MQSQSFDIAGVLTLATVIVPISSSMTVAFYEYISARKDNVAIAWFAGALPIKAKKKFSMVTKQTSAARLAA